MLTMTNAVGRTWTYATTPQPSVWQRTSDGTGARRAARRAEDSFVSALGEASVRASQDRNTNHDGSYVLITYDDALRVQSEAYRDAGGGVIDNLEYTYDLDGNRTTRRRGATIATSTLEEYTYAAGDELTTVSVGGTPTQTWEHDGNRLQSNDRRTRVSDPMVAK